MKQRIYRYFGGLLNSQEKWLNTMAASGQRLIQTGKTWYEFEECQPGEFQYCVEYIGGKSRNNAEHYKQFLEELGYRVFYKNLNLQWSTGKVRLHPWAEAGGKIVTESTTLDKELLIVEKRNDGNPFELHTSMNDRIDNLKQMQRPWVWCALLFLAFGIVMRHWLWLIFDLFYWIPAILFQCEIHKLKRSAILKE